MYSKALCSLLRDLPTFDLPAISVPASGKSIKSLLRLLQHGVTVSTYQEDLLEVEKAANVLNIELKDWNIKNISVPQSQVLTYSQDPVVVKYKSMKPNVIDMTNPPLEDLEIVGQCIRVEDDDIPFYASKSGGNEIRTIFPKTVEFESDEFKKRVAQMKKSGTNFRKRRKLTERTVLTKSALDSSGVGPEFPVLELVDEFAPGGLLNSDGASTPSESSVTCGERKAPRHRLFAEGVGPKELPETTKKNRVAVEDEESMNAYGSFDFGLNNLSTPRRISDNLNSTGTPRTPQNSVQRELYNSFNTFMNKKAEEAIKSIKQKKYFDMLKAKRLEAEKAKKEGLKFPCEKCDYVGAAPGNLKTHKMANHGIMERDAYDYLDWDNFSLWIP